MKTGRWWCCDEGIPSRYKQRLSANRARRRQGDCSFRSRRSPERSGVATARDSYRTMGNVHIYTEFELLEVEVHIGVLDTVSFSPPRDVDSNHTSPSNNKPAYIKQKVSTSSITIGWGERKILLSVLRPSLLVIPTWHALQTPSPLGRA